jgi:uncharacterized protein (DUF2384 family)
MKSAMNRSRILREVHETATAMRRAGVIDNRTMREFDALALSRRKATASIPRRDLRAFAEVYIRVVEFFGNTSKTSAWFRTANPLLGGVRPIEILLSGRGDRLLQLVKETDARLARPTQRQLSPAWVREIDDRVAELDSRAVGTISFAAVKALLRRKSKARSGRRARR